MPKLWTDTIESHRKTVREAALDAVAGLVAGRGLRSVTMSEIAEKIGIGRATLYKYFGDAEAILRAWHEREISRHFDELVRARDQAGSAMARLRAVLLSYALIDHRSRGHHDADVAALLHQDEQVRRAEHRLRALIAESLAEATKAGDVRGDVPSDELAQYCLHALGAAHDLPSNASVERLVEVTVAGLRPR